MTYGCYNRAPLQGQTLYGMDSATGQTIKIELPHINTKDCQYQKNDKYADAGCVGCKHKETK